MFDATGSISVIHELKTLTQNNHKAFVTYTMILGALNAFTYVPLDC